MSGRISLFSSQTRAVCPAVPALAAIAGLLCAAKAGASPSSRRRAMAVWLLFFFAMFAAPMLHADTTWCVNNTASFEQALNWARNDDTTIKLVRGDYLTFGIQGGSFDDELDHDLTILGGYADGSCSEEGRSLDPSLTVFHPAAFGGPYQVRLFVDADLLIKSVTLRGYGGGLSVSFPPDPFSIDNRWTLDRVRIERSGGQMPSGWVTLAPALSLTPSEDASLVLQQVAVVDNAAGDEFGMTCTASIYTNEPVTVKQSTFANNAGTSLCVIGSTQNNPVDIDNTIFWGSPLGLQVDNVPSSALHLRHNTIDGNLFDNPPSINVGNHSFNPQFLDPANGDYRLAVTSPAVDSGVTPPTGGQSASDIVGNPRVVGGVVDRGAWETDFSNATILFVTNTNAGGAGSLANAIAQSNTLAGTQVIRFNMPGNCPQVIFQFQGQALPDITDTVYIDGYSQPGSIPSTGGAPTICVGIWGNQEVGALMRVFSGGEAASLNVSGVGFGGTSLTPGSAAIVLFAGRGHQISGNQFGGFIGPAGNRIALNVLQQAIIVGVGARDSVIGGNDSAQRNYFNSARATAISIETFNAHPTGISVVNNYIGPAADGTTVDANLGGIRISNADGNFVLDNWISGNQQDGLTIANSGALSNIVVNNQIGRCPACLTPIGGSEILMPNGGNGVRLQNGASGNLIGLNRIAGNGGAGILQTQNGANRLVTNRIYFNAALGIDMNGDGVTLNNNSVQNSDGVQNFPLIGRAIGGFSSGTVSGALNAAPGRDYLVQIYASSACDRSGHGEGQFWIGATSVTTPPPFIAGFYSSANFSVPVSLSGGLAGRVVSAIAIDADGNSSEFSPCFAYDFNDLIFADDFD